MISTILTWVFIVVALGAGLLAVTRRSPLNCALSLVVSFVALSGIYFQLKAPFPAILQIILYAGAIMVLVIFVIMFLNVHEEELDKDEISKPGVITALFLLVPLAVILLGVIWGTEFPESPKMAPEGSLSPAFGTVSAVGTELFTRWMYPFEIISLLILVAMVGAVLLAKRRLD